MTAANETQWCDFWQRIGAIGSPLPIWVRLRAAYTEPWRQYHNLRHIGHCLSEFQSAPPLTRNGLGVEATIWFHDVIYDTKRKDNEERSAELADQILCDAGIATDFRKAVRQFILATKHIQVPTDDDAALMTDVDLSILGQNEETYAAFERQIRGEYSWVSEPEFAAGRSAVLKSFLDRERIFTTAHFAAKYEFQARKNLAWAVARLSR